MRYYLIDGSVLRTPQFHTSSETGLDSTILKDSSGR